jgi:hypothetical protein
MPQKLHGNFQDKFNDLNQSVIDVCKESLCSEMTNKLLNKIFDEKNNINFEWANILNESLRGEDSNKELCNQLTTKNPPESLSIKDIVVSHLNILELFHYDYLLPILRHRSREMSFQIMASVLSFRYRENFPYEMRPVYYRD